MVEEGSTCARLVECLGQEMPHAAPRFQTFHRLCRDNDRLRVFANVADVGEGAGEVDLQPRLFGGTVSRLREGKRCLAVEIGLWVDDKKWCKTAFHNGDLP